MPDDLRAPSTDLEWRAYHDIRRRVLFELRGRDAYDPHHPDELRADHHPLVLWHEGAAVAVIRVDVRGDVAIFRRVAVREDVQRAGHGRRLLQDAERFAKSLGCTRIESHVDPGAVGFYERCGFHRLDAESTHGKTTLMGKPVVSTIRTLT